MNFKLTTKINRSKDNSLIKLKLRIKKDLLLELNEIINVDRNDKLFYNNNNNKFLNIINSYLKKLHYINTKGDVKNLYKKYKKDYLEALISYNYEIWKFSKINNWDKNYSSIKELRSIHLTQINNILHNELNKYSNYSFFKNIKTILSKLKRDYSLICLYGYADIEKTKSDFNNAVVAELRDYKKRKRLLDELMCNKENIDSFTIKLLENSLNHNPILFDDIYSKINNNIKMTSKIKKLFINNS